VLSDNRIGNPGGDSHQGQGAIVDDLEWDIKLYFALAGAMHDCAVSAWGIKGWYDYLRPVSAIRYLSDYGQSSDPDGPSYDPRGITLRPGKIEVITAESSAVGERHYHLRNHPGKIAVDAWRGPGHIMDPEVDDAGAGWILSEDWWPYQRPTFVTPPFAGYVSGHSTFSRAGAIVLGRMTGSEFFPGGLGEFHCERNEFLVFEEGPSVDVKLQWATYKDASDQTSLSRIWGGIHPPADDIPGRRIGEAIGEDAVTKAISYFGVPTPGPYPFRRGDANDDLEVNIADASFLANFLFGVAPATPPRCEASTDTNGDDRINLADVSYLANFLFGVGPATAPPAPYPDCGVQGSEGLSCDNPLACTP
jgi:hypothetical protein